MRRLALFLLLFPALIPAAPSLEIVKPSVSQVEGGPPDSEAFEYTAGETLFLSCRVSGFAKNADQGLQLTYSIQAFDPKGKPLDQDFQAQISEQVLPQDKDWLPKIASSVAVPPLAIPGQYSIKVKVDDMIAKTSAEVSIPFHVRARTVEPSDSLIIRNLGFYHSETDAAAMNPPAYKASGEMWVRFDIIGFRYGPGNALRVTYQASILGAQGALLWKQPEPALDDTQSFYPKPYVPGSMGLGLEKVKPGTYTILVEASDGVGHQTCEARATFTVQ